MPLVKLNSWDELKNAMQTEYTISFWDVCELLKCSRPYVTTYISPHIPYIKISTGVIDGSYETPPWLYIMELQLKKSLNSSVWFHKEALVTYLTDNMTLERRTRVVTLRQLMSDREWQLYQQEQTGLKANIQAAIDQNQFKKIGALRHELQTCWKQHIPKDTFSIIQEPSITKRATLPWSPATVPDLQTFLYQMQPISELRSYGQSNESLYRELLRRGAIRATLMLQDEAGTIGKRVYYGYDKEVIPTKVTNGSQQNKQEDSIMHITVTELSYQDLRLLYPEI